MCGREVRRAVWEGEEWRKRENGGGLSRKRGRVRMKNGGGRGG
jgi:hypothetical protein